MSGRTPDQTIRQPVSLQRWENLTFLHWPYEPEAVQRLVADGLAAQEWDGVTWVGITPFRMVDVRAPFLPPPPGWDAFPELKVRAYVRRRDGQDGIWFLGMVVPRATVIAALRSLGLPYSHSRASVSESGSRWSYDFETPRTWRPRRRTGPRPAQRPAPTGWFRADVDVGRPLSEKERTPLVESLTGRWSAFHRRARVLWRTPVAHEPWPLHAATVAHDGGITAPLHWAGLPPLAQSPLVHAAPAVGVRFGPPRPA